MVLPATQDLVGAELQLVDRQNREAALRHVVEAIESDYDYIVVDCPPSLGLLTLNVLAAANTVLIPIQCEYYGLEGISQLLNTVRLVQQNFNTRLAISGVLLTMYDARLNLCRQVAEDAKEYFGEKMFVTPIRGTCGSPRRRASASRSSSTTSSPSGRRAISPSRRS